jgi:DeoR/GlpR family transcriptional regulator of sugar metabolism
VDAIAERHRLIADRLAALGRVEVGDLAGRLDVAPETIRRDLRLLEQQGLLQRVHGGAVLRAERPLSPFDGSTPDRPERHRRLADEVINRLPQAGAVYLGASPLTSAVAEALTRRPPTTGELTVVTTSLDVAVELSRLACLHVFNVGGSVNQEDRGQQGDWALSELRRLRVDLAVLPASGVTVEAGVFTASTMAGAVATTAIEMSNRVWLLIEAEALGQTGLMHAAPLDRLDRIFAAGTIDPNAVTPFTEAGIEVTIVE